MPLDQPILVGVSVLIPTIVFLLIQTLIGPFVVIWRSTVSYIGAHLLYFLGEWR